MFQCVSSTRLDGYKNRLNRTSRQHFRNGSNSVHPEGCLAQACYYFAFCLVDKLQQIIDVEANFRIKSPSLC